MKRQKQITGQAIILATVVALLTISVASAAPPSPFVGFWKSVDIDGSNQTLLISPAPGNSNRLFLFDRGATVCGLDSSGNPLYPATARGRGAVSGSDLSGTWNVWCLSRPVTFYGNVGFNFTYDSGADTLTDGIGVVWHRH
jgi:hypothetical protein